MTKVFYLLIPRHSTEGYKVIVLHPVGFWITRVDVPLWLLCGSVKGNDSGGVSVCGSRSSECGRGVSSIVWSVRLVTSYLQLLHHPVDFSSFVYFGTRKKSLPSSLPFTPAPATKTSTIKTPIPSIIIIFSNLELSLTLMTQWWRISLPHPMATKALCLRHHNPSSHLLLSLWLHTYVVQ